MSYIGLVTLAPVYWETATNFEELENSSSELPELQRVPDLMFDCEIRIESLKHAVTNRTVSQAPRKLKFDPFSSLPPNLDRNYFNFPFLTDRSTFTYLNDANTKVMFIMRGLSGSGKSSIVDVIRSSYKNVVVCSADDYFNGEDGSYKFNEKLLSSAHSDCQQKAKQACRSKVPIVVIDNTNVRKWEMKFYADLANVNGYVVVKVQPKTPWQWDATELAARNKHGMMPEIIQKKILKFDDVIPAYYGWFPNEKRSKSLIKLCTHIFLECLSKFPQLKRDLLRELRIKLEKTDEETANGILSGYYSQQSNLSPLLHCTAKYCAWGKPPGAVDYHKRSDVQQACGQMFSLTVTGLVITKKTLGARVSLGSPASDFFDRPEEKDWDSQKFLREHGTEEDNMVDESYNYDQIGKKGKGKRNKRQRRSQKKKNQKFSSEKRDDGDDKGLMRELNGGLHIPKTSKETHDGGFQSATPGHLENRVQSPSQIKSGTTVLLSEMFPSLNYTNRSRSAHFTVKTVMGAHSRDVNFDILHACDVEMSTVHTLSDFVLLSHGHACYYGNGLCCVYFDAPVKVRTLFSGYY